MAEKIIMPKQGLQMTEGTITKWLVKEGDQIKVGQPIFEMETDKNTIQIDSTAEGEMLKIIAKEDETVPITETIAIVGKKGEDFSALLPSGTQNAAPEAAEAVTPAVNEADIPVKRIIMPKQGLQMTEGTITRWLVKEGDTVKVGQPIFEMETDKNTIQIDSTASGTVLKLVAAEGDVVPITETIAFVGEPGTDISPLLVKKAAAAPTPTENAPAAAPAPAVSAPASISSVPAAAGERKFVTPRAKMTADRKNLDWNTVAGTGPNGLVIERDVLAAATVKASPTAKAIAAQAGISITSLTGSGENGKIVKHDVLAGSADARREDKIVALTGIRKTIADNMMNSVHSMAHAYHKVKVDMTQAGLIRTAFKKAEKKLSYNDIIIMALGRALQEYPRMNALVEDNKIIEKAAVNVGIAVAIENGLIVPTVRDVQNMTLSQVHEASAQMIKKAQTGGLKKEDYSGATFTVSNLGMYDIDEFTAIINPPQVGILAIGKISDTPVAEKGQVVIRPIVNLTLTYDHRVIDGAPAAEFLRRVKELLENPYLMIV